MTAPVSGAAVRRLSVLLLGLALAGSPVLVSAPAGATAHPDVTAATSATGEACVEHGARSTKWREEHDTTEVSAAVKARVNREVAELTGRRDSRSAAASALPSSIRIPVYIHVIRGTHRRDRRLGYRAAKQAFYTLRGAFAGGQDSSMEPTGVNFDLKQVTVTRKDSWFHAGPFSRADRAMKRRLHRGSAQTLNIYITGLTSRKMLGFALFPWQAASYPRLDGVTVNVSGLPGGSARGYNLGDTVVHETGHWLGALHTFEGGCQVGGAGDGVWDTPAERDPNYYCPIVRNSCAVLERNQFGIPTLDLPDPIHNFMDYSYDTCMNHFTPVQRDRMVALYMKYRYGR